MTFYAWGSTFRLPRQRLGVELWVGLLAMSGCAPLGPDNAGGGGAEGRAAAADASEVGTPGPDIDDNSADDLPSGEHEGMSALPPTSMAIACTQHSQCATGYCYDGVCCNAPCNDKCMACTVAKKGSGVDGVCGPIKYDTDPDNECLNGSCDGAYQCRQYNGLACTSSGQCLSKYCVDGYCCNNLCMGACQACSAAKKGSGSNGACGIIAASTDPDNECTGGECNGSGACTTPQTTASNGSACASAAQCASGYCADGVCCDNSCLGTCQACTAAKKGQGVDGTCGSLKYDTDPDAECWGGSCNGKGHCQQYNGTFCSSNSQCLSSYCIDGFCCGNVCSGTCQACSAFKKGQGSDGSCGMIVSGRDADNECSPGECNGSGTCNAAQIPQAIGSSCTNSAQCQSGFCVDGFCCDKACSGACQACTAAKKGSGTNGACGPIKYDTDPDDECWGGSCDGKNVCKQYNGVVCNGTSDCLSGHCSDGYCCNQSCSGIFQACNVANWAGSCKAAYPTPCTGTIGLPNAPDGANVPISYAMARQPIYVVAGDFNGDGKRDIATYNRGENGGLPTVSVASGQGNGVFGAATEVSHTTWDSYVHAATDTNRNGYFEITEQKIDQWNLQADFSGDGRIDLISYRVAIGQIGWGQLEDIPDRHYMDIYVRNAAGVLEFKQTFWLAEHPTTQGSHYPFPPFAAADFNGDGRLDLVVATYNNVNLYVNQGNATFTASQPWGFGLVVDGIAAGDMNGDAKSDIVMTWGGNSSNVYPGNGNGTFAQPFNIGAGGMDMRLADMNADGRLDMLTRITGGINLHINNGNGTFGAAKTYATGSSSSSIFIADMDNDDRFDILAPNDTARSVSILLNRCLP